MADTANEETVEVQENRKVIIVNPINLPNMPSSKKLREMLESSGESEG